MHKIIKLDAIDNDGDVVPYVVIVPDYNGDPVVHAFVTGERILRMFPADDWDYELIEPATTDERQAHASLAYHVGAITETQDQVLANVWGTDEEIPIFEAVMTDPADDHAVVAWVGLVAWAVHAVMDDLAAPTGM